MAFTQSNPQKDKNATIWFQLSWISFPSTLKVFQVTCLVTDDLLNLCYLTNPQSREFRPRGIPTTGAHESTLLPGKHRKHTQIPNTNKYRYTNIYKCISYINQINNKYLQISQILYVTSLCISVSNAQMQSSWRISPLTSVQSETFETICWCSQPPCWLRMEHVIPQSDGLMLLGQPRIPQH